MANWDEIKHEWETTKITLADLAEKHGVKLGTLKSRKSRDAKDSNPWSRDGTKKDATKIQKVASKIQKVASEEVVVKTVDVKATKDAKSDRKRGGNPNPNYRFPKHNKVAEKHGFYSKVIPEELMELFDELEDGISTVDMLWDQIKVQYMAIMRAQSIMLVTGKNEMIKELKKAKYDFIQTGEGEDKSIERVAVEEEYNFQFAWERHAQFLTAQSRAIGELRSLIDQFETTADKNDERLLKLKKMRLDIKKTKAEITNLEGDQNNNVGEDWTEILLKVAERRRLKDEKE